MNDTWVKVSMTCIGIVVVVMLGCYLYSDMGQVIKDNPGITDVGAPYPIINLAAMLLVVLILTIIIYWLSNKDEDKKDE
jgi:uncharacterized BrkB/YihY/UPF0761 family membrane protein